MKKVKLKTLLLNSMNLPSQLRLAAEIIESNKAWEIFILDEWITPHESHLPLYYVNIGVPIRLAPAAGPVPPEGSSIERKARAFEILMELSNTEDDDGEFAVTLFYNNSQDGAHVKNSKGETISECYELSDSDDTDPEQWPEEQFLRAIEKLAIPIPAQPATEYGCIDPEELKEGDWYQWRKRGTENWRGPCQLIFPEDGDLSKLAGWNEFRRCAPPKSEPLPATETRRVPLGHEDVPPGSVFQITETDEGFRTPVLVSPQGVVLLRKRDKDDDIAFRAVRFEELMEMNAKIKRLGSIEWLPCSKTES